MEQTTNTLNGYRGLIGHTAAACLDMFGDSDIFWDEGNATVTATVQNSKIELVMLLAPGVLVLTVAPADQPNKTTHLQGLAPDDACSRIKNLLTN